MSLISGVGDFFRGAFGETDEQKRQRKLREAQQAAAQQQQAQANQVQQQQAQQRTAQALVTANPDQPPAPTPTPAAPKLQQTKPPSVPAPPVVHNVNPQTIININHNPQPVVAHTPPPTTDLARSLFLGNKNKALNEHPELRARLLSQANEPQPSKISYVQPAFNDAVLKESQDVARFPAEAAQSARDYVFGQGGETYTPGSRVEKAIFGDRPIQSIQEKTKQQYQRDTQNETGYRHTLAKPLAAGEVAMSIINDLPVVGLAARGASKGARGVAKLFARGGKVGKDIPAVTDPLATQEAEAGAVDAVQSAAQEADATPAFERKKAAEAAKNEVEGQAKAADAKDPLNRPTYAHSEDVKNIIATADQKFTEYVTKHPELSQGEIDAAREVAKKRAEKLIADLQTGRNAGMKAIEDQRAAEQASVTAQQEAVQGAQDTKAAEVAPNPKSVVEGTPQAPNPELHTNNGYADASTGVLDAVGTNPGTVKRGGILYDNPIARTFFKGQQKYVEAVNKARDKGAELAQEAIQGKNSATRGAAEGARILFKNAGQKDAVREALIKRTSHIQNAGRVAAHALKTIEAEVKAIGNPAQTYERIYRVLETPEFLQRVFGDGTKLSVNDLSPAERNVFDKLVELNKIRNRINLETGVINKDQYFAFENGMHSPRIYDINVEHPEMKDFVSSSRYKDLKAGIKRKDIKDVPDYVLSQLVDSPFQASALRLETALKNKANDEALGNLDQQGALLTKAPNDNFVPLTGKKYGKYEGKYIDKQILSQIDNKDYYNSEVGQKIGDSINAFHNSVLGAPGRAYKQFRTVFSPGTFVGNVGSGQLAFSGAANINPVTSTVRTLQATKQLASKGINANVQEAELNGLFAGNTGRQITHSKEADSAIRGGKTGVTGKAKNLYGGVDKATALGWYNELRARGLTPEQAVQRVHLGMQNYDNAGRLINALSDTPVLGKPFARFTPELLRIIKNNLIYNPLGTGAKVGTAVAGADYLTNQAGESPEARASRENAPGQTKIGPVSLNIPIPDKIDAFGHTIDLPGHGTGVNVARTIGLNFPQEPNGDPNAALLRQISPVADVTRTNPQGEQVFAPNQVVSDMFYKQFADQAANRDFLGRQITDPANKTYYENGNASVHKFSDTLSPEDKTKNRLHALLMGLPGAPEADALISAVKKQDDYYGKTRTVPQAIMRAFGLKTEDNSPAAQQKRVESQQYFDEALPAVQKFVQDNPDLANTYFKLRNPERNRDTNTKTSDLISPEKWKLINGDSSGRLFDFIKSQAVAQSANDPTKPLDPLYSLPPDQAKYVLELRSRPTGDDIEAQDILRANSSWYADYENKYHDYLNQNEKWFQAQPQLDGAAQENPRVTAYSQVSPPVDQPPLVAEYMKIKAQDPTRAKAVYAANKDALSAAFDQYAVQKLQRINALRKIEGYEPISLDTYKNDTFGFDVKGGSGGYGSGGGNPADYTNDLGTLTNFINSINPPAEAKAQSSPNVIALFQKLLAGGGGGRNKPTIGASASGR